MTSSIYDAISDLLTPLYADEKTLFETRLNADQIWSCFLIIISYCLRYPGSRRFVRRQTWNCWAYILHQMSYRSVLSSKPAAWQTSNFAQNKTSQELCLLAYNRPDSQHLSQTSSTAWQDTTDTGKSSWERLTILFAFFSWAGRLLNKGRYFTLVLPFHVWITA